MTTTLRMKHLFLLFNLIILSSSFGVFANAGDPYKLFEDQGKQGLKNTEGNVVIPAKYESIGWSKGGLEVVNNTVGYKTAEGWGLISLSNEIITKPEYMQIYPSGRRLIIAAKKGKVSQREFLGAISTDGKVALPFKYASITISDLRAIVSNKSGREYRYGVVDLGGKEILPMNYKEIIPLGNLRYAVKNQNNKTAIYNDNGKQIVDFSLDSISPFKAGYAVVFENHERGLVNTNGVMVSPVGSKDFDLSGEVPKKLDFNTWFILDQDQTEIDTLAFDDVEPVSEDYLQVYCNEKTWLIDSVGNALTPKNIDELVYTPDGLMAFRKKQKWGVMTQDSKEVLSARFDSVYLSNDMIYCREKVGGVKKWSLYDVHGVKKSTQLYDNIGPETSYIYPVKKGKYWGFINRAGDEVIHCVYDEVTPVIDGYLMVKFHGEYGVIDKVGRWIVFPQPKFIKVINDDYYLELDRNLTNLKSFEDGTVYFTQNKVEVFENYLLEYLNDGSVWKVDFEGRILNKPSANEKYQEVRKPTEGFYPVKINGQYGFIDNQNRLRIANRYDDVGNFSEELAAIKLLGRWGFIDKRERIVVQPLYNWVSGFEDGLSIASTNSGMGLINAQGTKVSAFDYDSVYHESNGRYVIIKNGKKGLINKAGRLIVNPKYDELVDLGNGRVIVKKFKKYGVINLHGVDVIPLIYDKLYFDKAHSHYLAMKKTEWKEVELP
ncbi:WG repeat-containing protein [Fulvivirga sediminis]|uniref:WG repeat-containing protein n=1 Tax=Fulvivirga sediminis TaxID=2803949 RepID=A0A937JXW4_9BACT|nr:WG repeat-containing protein [Fulvivirga sediminis]MBL3655059.1 WG repeat-containing protein [Fulvivirga sediminis]